MAGFSIESPEGRRAGRDVGAPVEPSFFDIFEAGLPAVLRDVAERLPYIVCLKDTLGSFLYVNPAGARFLGADDPSEVEGVKVRDLLPPGAAAVIEREDAEAMATAEPVREKQEEIVLGDGKRAWIRVLRTPLRDENKRVTGLLTLAREISEEREVEERLLSLNADLFAALADLKNANTEMQAMQMRLIEAGKMESVGRLAAGVAHEVKNPLAIIRMGIEYITQILPAGDLESGAVLNEMNDAVQRADVVIKGLLDFASTRRLELEPMDLNRIVQRAITLVRGEAVKRKCSVKADLDPDLPPVEVDELKVSQVLVNVMLNALNAMSDGGCLRIRTGSTQLQNSMPGTNLAVGSRVAAVDVDDSGPGIPESHLARVFDPFFTTNSGSGGTGLGLTVCKSIMDLHGGAIRIRNRPEGGVRVALTFKAAYGETKNPDR